MKAKIAVVVPGRIKDIPRIYSLESLKEMPSFTGFSGSDSRLDTRKEYDEETLNKITQIFVTLN